MPGAADKVTYTICMMHSVEKRRKKGSDRPAKRAQTLADRKTDEEPPQGSSSQARATVVFTILN